MDHVCTSTRGAARAPRWGRAFGALALAGGLAVVAPACSSHGRSAAGAATGAPTLRGTFTLWGAKTEADPCHTRSGFTDIATGTPVAVSDGSRRVLVHGVLGAGTADPRHLGCVYRFSLAGVPRADTYTVAVGGRDGLTYARGDLVRARWQVSLNLGVTP